ncbi:MAG: hypothetical protein E7588_05515 [Ruminococcaceae bacterium]|nr:hypothetical protein [Oscillospiraceae bacterium]
MKKALLTISALLILCMAMTLCAGAVIQDSDIGTYIRFDSQEKIDLHTVGNLGDISMDAENNALRYTTRYKTADGNDLNMRVIFDERVKIEDYPFVRITYKMPTTQTSGAVNTSFSNVHMFVNQNGNDEHGHISINIGSYGNTMTANDKWERIIFDLRIANNSRTTTVDKETVPVAPETYAHDFRFDFPNNEAANTTHEYLIYDVGMFKTAEAAASYNGVQDFYYHDLSVADNGLTWEKKGGEVSFTYDEGEKAYLWHHVSGDSRMRSSMIESINWFSPSTWPVFSTYYKSTAPSLATFLYNDGYSPRNADGTDNTSIKKVGSMAEGKISTTNGSGVLNSNAKANEWSVGKLNIANASTNAQFSIATAAVLTRHGGDWINTSGDEQETHFKYIAYYATEEEANKMTVGAPEVTGVMPADKETENGKISGVTAKMEYRAGGKGGEWIAITDNDITDGAIFVAPGQVYSVRYKATETANAGYIAEVYVPYYFKFNLTGVKNGSSMELYDAEIDYVDGRWKVELPYGSSLTNIVLVFDLESNVSNAYQLYNNTHVAENKSRAGVALYQNSQNVDDRKAVISGDSTIDASASTVQLTAVQPGAIHEYINIDVSVSESQYTDKEIVDMALAAIDAAVIPTDDLYALSTADEIENAVKGTLETAISGFAGAQLALEAEFISPAASGTAENRNGTDGKVNITCTVTYDSYTDSTVKEDVPVPAKPFRWILNFGGNEIMLDNIKSNVIYNGGLEVENKADDSCLGGSYAHIYKRTDAEDTEGFYFSIYPGQNGVPAIDDLSEYKVVVYSYKHSNSSDKNNQLYYYTNLYSGAHAYQSFNMNNTAGVADTEWHQRLYEINASGNLSGTTTGDYSWNGTPRTLRFDFQRGINEVGEENRYVDLDYIGFFATMEEAQEFIASPVLDSNADEEALEVKFADELGWVAAGKADVDAGKYDYTASTVIELMNNNNMLHGAENGIVLIDELVNAQPASIGMPGGKNGKLVYRVAFADSFINGNVIYSPAYTVTIKPTTPAYINVFMAGAQIRTEDAAAAMGGEAAQHGEALRFGAYLDLNGWQNEAGVTDVEYGMILTSAAILGEDELTLDMLDENRIIKVVAKNIYKHNEYDEGCDQIIYTAAIYGVGDKTAKIVARPYVTYKYNGNPVVVYGHDIVRSFKQVFDKVTGVDDGYWDSDAQ